MDLYWLSMRQQPLVTEMRDKGRNMRNLLRYSLALLFAMSMPGAQALELMTEDDPPNNMIRDGKVSGIAADKLAEAFRRAGVAQRMQLVPWARAYQSALTQPGYCAFSAARTTGREPLFKWIGPVAATDWVLYMPAGLDKPAHLEEVRRETIGGYVQDVISVWLAENGFRVDAATADAANPRKLMAGRIRYWASSPPRANALIVKEGLVGQIVPVLTFGHTGLYLACHATTEDALVQRLNQALQKMKDDGTSARIEARYARWPAE
jgi:polar amino acid transport system substrate-binding protein